MGDEWFVYIGTYTRGKSEGICVYRMDRSTGAHGGVRDQFAQLTHR